MRITGDLIFTQRNDEPFNCEWQGGRRIGINGGLFRALGGRRAGKILEIGGVRLRIVALESSLGSYQDIYVAMREGRLARFVAWYVRSAIRWADPLFRWECKWIWGTEPAEGETIPRRTLTALLLRWV